MTIRLALSASVAMGAVLFMSMSAWAQNAPQVSAPVVRPVPGKPTLLAQNGPSGAQSDVKGSAPGRSGVGVVSPLSTQAKPKPLYYRGKGFCRNNDCLLRFDEDYAYMRNGVPSGQEDFFDPLKYIPLNHAGDIYMSFNANLRVNYFHDLLFNTPNPVGDRNEVDIRTNVGTDLHLGPYARIYADVWNGQYFGPLKSPPANNLNDAETDNLFLELMDWDGPVHVGVRIGEQEMDLGDGLVIADTELGNIPNTWDGIRAYADWGFARVDAFAFDEVNTADGHFHEEPSSQGQLAGVYGSADLPKFHLSGLPGKTSIDPYYLYYRQGNYSYDDTVLETGTAHGQPSFVTSNSIRDTFGLRYYGKIGPFDLDNTVEFQGGSFGTRSVSAWMFAFNNGYTFNAPWKPRIGFHLDGASGGDSSNGGTIHTYQPMFYSALYYNANLVLAPTNFYDFGPHLVIQPLSWMLIDTSDTWYWRQNQHDAIYNGLYAGPLAVNLYSQTANIKGAYTGNQITTTIISHINKHIDSFVTLAYFLPGSPLKQIGADNQFEAAVLIGYKF